MTNSELILSTYKEIVTRLDQPYYILEGLSNNSGDNQILHCSPSIKQITGISQFDLARNSKLLFDSIHPDFIDEYIESNKKLLRGASFDTRKYLIKHQITGEFVPVTELATACLNEEKNYFEIYCTVKRTDLTEEGVDTLSNDIGIAVGDFAKPDYSNFKQLNEAAHYFVERMAHHFKMSAVRFYGFDNQTKRLFNIADSQNKRYQQRLENLTGAKVKGLVPTYHDDSLFYKFLLSNKSEIIDDQKSIVELIKCHTDSSILKKMATAAVKIYRVKSFGVLPIICPLGNTVGVVTFGAPKHYTDKGKQHIIDYATTNSFILTPILCECFDY